MKKYNMDENYKKGAIEAMSIAVNLFNCDERIREGVLKRMKVLPQENVIKSVCECDYPKGKCEKGKICEKCNTEINW